MSLHKDHVTIVDIARAAGVSIATVSRVLTGKTNVREETKKKILQVIEQYQYQPNFMARALHDRISKTIGIIVPSLNNPFFVKICNEAEIYANTAGYTLLYGVTNNRYENETRLLHTLIKRQVDGFIFLGGRINEVAPGQELEKDLVQITKEFPVVLINGQYRHENCYMVRTDEKKAFQTILQYVLQCNHREIGLITGERGIWPTEEKITCFKDALEEADLPFYENRIVSGEYTVESGMESIRQLLKTKPQPSAVLCTNDILAIGAIKAASQLGFKVPEELSITGFDDIDFSHYYMPGITTIQQNYTGLAESAIQKIIAHINEDKNVEKETVLDTKLIIRESCLKLP